METLTFGDVLVPDRESWSDAVLAFLRYEESEEAVFVGIVINKPTDPDCPIGFIWHGSIYNWRKRDASTTDPTM